MKTDQRDGSEYEFDCVVRLDTDAHFARVEKVRGCTAMDGRFGECPGPDFWAPLIGWWLSAPPAKSLFETHADSIRSAPTLSGLRAVMEIVNVDVRAERLSKQQIADLGALKDERKDELAAGPQLDEHGNPVFPGDAPSAGLFDNAAPAGPVD